MSMIKKGACKDICDACTVTSSVYICHKCGHMEPTSKVIGDSTKCPKCDADMNVVSSESSQDISSQKQ